MPRKSKFIRRGYFPKELPPAFSSLKFAKLVTSANAPQLRVPPQTRVLLPTHSIPRPGGMRRVLGIPNPVLHASLATEIADNWALIRTQILRSPLAASAPKLVATSGRAAVPKFLHGDLPVRRAFERKRGRFVLEADVAEYYSTFYTHSIPWVLHGKEYAKQHQREDNLGNRLDRLVRNAQDRQTNGIPVGPDTSFVLGELVLSTVDVQLADRIGHLSGHRHYDDYELVFETRSDAEACLIALQACMNEVGLQLNGRKTRILELPQLLDVQWRDFVRNFNGFEGRRPGAHRVIAFFNGVFNAHQTWPESHVLAYAIGRIEKEEWADDEIPTLQALLQQCATARPEAVAPVLRLIARFKVEDRNLDYGSLQDLLNDLVVFHSRRLNVNEVAWCLWAAMAFERELSSGAAEQISRLDDPFVALLALDAMSRGLVRGPLDTSRWKVEMTANGLYGKHWPLAYEALRRGWLTSAEGTDYIAQDDCYSFLRRDGAGPYVRFTELTPAIVESMRLPRVEYGIESIDDEEDLSLDDFDL